MQVKGTAIVILPEFVRKNFGTEGLERWLSGISPRARELFTSAILINEWYPFQEIYLQPTEQVCQLFYNNEVRGAWEVGRFSADYALKGVYKAFVKLTSVKYFITRASAVITTYYQPSAMTVRLIENNRAVIHMTQFPMHSLLAEHRVAGWIQRSLEIHNCRDVRVEMPSSLARGDPQTEFVLTWQ